MMSDNFGRIWSNFKPSNVRFFFGSFQTPQPPLKSDINNGRSQRVNKQTKLDNNFDIGRQLEYFKYEMNRT